MPGQNHEVQGQGYSFQGLTGHRRRSNDFPSYSGVKKKEKKTVGNFKEDES